MRQRQNLIRFPKQPGEKPCRSPPPDPDVADTAPSDSVLTVYDEQHVITYLRLLDADAVGADWRAVARIVLHLDPEHESDRARRAFESHLSRAKWMTKHGYRHLLRDGASAWSDTVPSRSTKSAIGPRRLAVDNAYTSRSGLRAHLILTAEKHRSL
jgi:Uncharacterized conserved protein (DUF2285)